MNSEDGESEVTLFLVLGFLQGVRGEFTDDVSETAVGPIFTGQELGAALYRMGPGVA